jgi:hypothetical protein
MRTRTVSPQQSSTGIWNFHIMDFIHLTSKSTSFNSQ